MSEHFSVAAVEDATTNRIRIPWARPSVGLAEADAARDAIVESALSMGRRVRAFEEEMAEHSEREHAVAVCNGTDALEIAMLLAGVQAGDEVLVSALSYIATVNCVIRAGAVPVFCDVDPATLNIDPDEIDRRITPRSAAVLVSDYCGFALDYVGVERACATHGLLLINDGAQAIGTRSDGRATLSRGLVSTTSFHAAKVMTTGEGGMVFVDDPDLAELARRLRGQGEVPGKKYIHSTLGGNHRMTDFQAAIGRVQLNRLGEMQEARARQAVRYTAAFDGSALITTTQPRAGTVPSWFSFPVLINDRDGVASDLRSAGIETRSLYPIPTYRQPIAEYPPVEAVLPAAEWACARVLNLPMFFDLCDSEIDDITQCLIESVERRTERTE